MEDLRKLVNGYVYPRSLHLEGSRTFFLFRIEGKKRLGIVAPSSVAVDDFPGETRKIWWNGKDGVLRVCELTAQTAKALRNAFPHLRPQLLGLHISAGFGDRLGLATPGHVRAVCGTGIAPIFAQQSVREMSRTARTPQQVMDDAMWGVFQEGWQETWGADADHLKRPEDIDAGLDAGFTFFTIDPGDHVDNEAHTARVEKLREKVAALPWNVLEDDEASMRRRYLGRRFELADGTALEFDEVSLLRAAAKYGKAIAHTVTMYRHLKDAAGGRPFELEVSVDETETPTTHLEHLFIVNEFRRLDVEWVSLAPRYIGRFEKGVDYIGDLDAFEKDLAVHVAIMRTFGPYKMSIHSGSDKFSIYPIFTRVAGELVHLKTAGTSYLEALRAVAQTDPALFREILGFARERYPEDRATYHVSAELEKVPMPEEVPDDALPGLLDQFDARQVLHVTYGSVLMAKNGDGRWRFKDRLFRVLEEHEEEHYEALERHFRRHLAGFLQK